MMGMPAKILTGANKVARYHQSLRNLDAVWRGKIADEVLKARDKHEPFCPACAILQLNEKIEAIKKNVDSQIREGRLTEIRLELDIDFDKCRGKNLKFLGEAPIKEKRIGVDTKISYEVIGHYKDYECINNHKLSVEVLEYERDEWGKTGRKGKGLEKGNTKDNKE